MSLLEIKHVTVQKGEHCLLQDVSLSIESGEWLGLIGESGSGKSLTAAAIGKLLPPEMQMKGSILIENLDISSLKQKDMQKARGSLFSYVFQDYYSSFTPFFTIGRHFLEYIKTHRNLSKRACKTLALEALHEAGLPAERVYRSYPVQLSGGQLQRASIAMAMLLKPKLFIADEPTTALDSITSHHILDLICKMKKETNCAVLFITHDLRHIGRHADRIAVMKEGRIIETGEKTKVLAQPVHPYTKHLISSVPVIEGLGTSMAKAGGNA
ncbi:ABC transporter ATP-binding protein [Bacillus subtilis]|nr:ABC transporter ATP-binding protein [Bacillus subtilis]TYS09129.1 ABC transporter ATP-binding protein [Bacillus subtilis]